MIGHSQREGGIEPTEAALNGQCLHGDDFSPSEIEDWFREEAEGYFRLPASQTTQGQNYGYHALNSYHGFSRLSGMRFSTCLVLGCGSGNDVEPIAGQVDKFVCIEPAQSWWREDIGGTPAEFRMPDPLGTIDLSDGSVDLVISFGVLHHIPNVSYVVGEVARIIRPGGRFVLREPISWMGDWRRFRPGLTRNERGIPVNILNRMAERAGLEPKYSSYCMVIPLLRAARKLGYSRSYNNTVFVRLDAAISWLLSWNVEYRRESLLSKIAPSSIFSIYAKTGEGLSQTHLNAPSEFR